MGKYLDAISNLNASDINFSISIKNDSLTQAIESSVEISNGYIGVGIFGTLWFVLYEFISNTKNQFNLSQMQSIISTNTMVFSLSVILVLVGIITSIQVFVWSVLLLFFGLVIGVLRT